MQKIAIIKTYSQAKDIQTLVDGYIIPIDNLSINYEKTFSIEDINKIKKLNKKTFISLNKNIHNNELNNLIETLKEIEKQKIDGILFYDIALLNIHKNLKLKTPLIWAQEHLTTNWKTINYWQKEGIKGTYISSELTKQELDEIRENTTCKLFIQVFGYIPMFTSKRHLIDNYQNNFNLKITKNKNFIQKEEKKYPIIDQKEGTTVYSNYILNIIDQNINKYDYAVYNSTLIDNDNFIQVLKGESIYPQENGFLYQETYYKVK